MLTSKFLKLPLMSEMPKWVTAKPSLEWPLSTFQFSTALKEEKTTTTAANKMLIFFMILVWFLCFIYCVLRNELLVQVSDTTMLIIASNARSPMGIFIYQDPTQLLSFRCVAPLYSCCL